MSRAVCLNCMDGRVQIPVIEWIKNNHGFDYVDMITEPGMDGLVADDSHSIDSLVSKLKISIEKNQAAHIFVVGHHDCKGNPVGDQEHQEHIISAVDRIKEAFPALSIVGLWINDQWKGEKVKSA